MLRADDSVRPLNNACVLTLQLLFVVLFQLPHLFICIEKQHCNFEIVRFNLYYHLL